MMLLLRKAVAPLVSEDDEWVMANPQQDTTSPRSLGWHFVQEQTCNVQLSYKDAILMSKGGKSGVSAVQLNASKLIATEIFTTQYCSKGGKENVLVDSNEEAADLEDELSKPGPKPAKTKSKKQKKH